MMAKKERSDTLHKQTEIVKDAIKGINPPDCIKLENQEMPFWYAIIKARAEWTEVDLIHAANLARCMASIETNQRELKLEGDVIVNQRGTPIMNPRFSVLEQLSRRAVAVSSKIQVHAAATIGESKLSRGKNKAKREAVEAFDDLGDDDLIARPH